MAKQPAVYLLASGFNGTLYTGVTSNLAGRIWQHKSHAVAGFTARYDVVNLVWYELHLAMPPAIEHEKRIKHWRRAWKIRLIEERNPTWIDLWPSLLSTE